MKRITVVSPCYNEEANVRELYEQVKAVFARHPEYAYEHLFIDNASKDRTVAILKEIASADRNVKLIVNSRNFGHLRSPYHALLQVKTDAAILMASDLQDPPAMVEDFLKKWEEGFQVVVAVKNESDEFPVMFWIRRFYYRLVSTLADIELIQNFTGFGLYDRVVLDALRSIRESYPYFRGLVSEVGFASAKVPFRQPRRARGITKNNFYTLYDTAMLGITNHSKVPLRMATMLGFAMSALSLLIAFGYFIAKLVFWSQFTLGMAPILIGFFFFSSVQLFFIGILGEYIGAIHTQVQARPLVIEKERVNF
jgi:glycosyltransferase involved in cell wall biosynthesis